MPQTSYDVGESQESSAVKEVSSKKPDDTAFKQQKLPAWQPILTPKSVLPTFFVVAIVFIPLGVVLLTTSDGVVENLVAYTDCDSMQTPGMKCSELRLNSSRMAEPCTCLVNFTITKRLASPVFVYYGMTNFFQNHRRYVKSRDDIQLIGKGGVTVDSSCEPYRYEGVDQTPIAPCGAIANSLFNDTYTLQRSDGTSLNVDRTNIAWYTDHTIKFNNPPPLDNLTAAFEAFAKPAFWTRRVEELDPLLPSNNGYKNEAFEVWMRTAAFPTFRKLYGRLGNQSLEVGEYSIEVDYNYPVTAFDGTKSIILSTTSWMGGKNNFLGIAYIVVGSLSFIVGIGLCIIHYASSRNNTRHE